MNICLHCGKETINPKFCSRSCAASYNNKATPKRTKKERTCKICGTTVSTRNMYCTKCSKERSESIDAKTLADLQYNKQHRSSAWAAVRSRARFIMSKQPQVCEKCGYDKHVEVAHKKSISSFPLDTPVSVVNSKDNLMLLCPNCHWEYDHSTTSSD